MTRRETMEAFIEARTRAQEELSHLDAQYLKRRADKERAERSMERISKKMNTLTHPWWHDYLVVPIAEYFAKEYDARYEISGPFGIRSETSIYWHLPDGSVKHLLLTPANLPGLHYDTGEMKSEFTKGSIGSMNGMNNVSAPLPEEWDGVRAVIRDVEEDE